MEINGQNYSSYASSYINTADNKKNTESCTSNEPAGTGKNAVVSKADKGNVGVAGVNMDIKA